MGFWTIASYAAWIVSALIFLWMLWDAIKVGREYDEDLLQSSREGVDQLQEHGDPVRPRASRRRAPHPPSASTC